MTDIELAKKSDAELVADVVGDCVLLADLVIDQNRKRDELLARMVRCVQHLVIRVAEREKKKAL